MCAGNNLSMAINICLCSALFVHQTSDLSKEINNSTEGVSES